MYRRKVKDKDKRKKCHWGNVFVFKAQYKGKILKFYAGGLSRGFDPETCDVTITAVDPEIPMSNLFVVNSEPKFVYLPIPDFLAPEWSKDFWLKVLDNIVSAIPKDHIKIGVMCVGGHGRTGTILAIYAGLLLDVDKPIEFVRRRYCENAVESVDQAEYVAMITGKQEDVMPSKGIQYPSLELDDYCKWYDDLLDGSIEDVYEEPIAYVIYDDGTKEFVYDYESLQLVNSDPRVVKIVFL